MKQKIFYICDYCGKAFESSENCKEHENVCEYNPENKTCRTCANTEKYSNLCYCRTLQA